MLTALSAAAFQSLPTDVGAQTVPGLSHTSPGSRTPLSLPPSVPLSLPVCFSTLKLAVKWLFQRRAGGRKPKMALAVFSEGTEKLLLHN